MGMEQFVSLFSICHSQELFVEFLDSRVVMGFPRKHFAVLLVQRLRTFCLDVDPVADIGELQRLTSAVDAAARTRHDFHKVELFSSADGFHQFSRVAQSMRNRGAYLQISATVLSAASITPPVVPKMAPAPDASPNGLSKSLSPRSGKSIPTS